MRWSAASLDAAAHHCTFNQGNDPRYEHADTGQMNDRTATPNTGQTDERTGAARHDRRDHDVHHHTPTKGNTMNTMKTLDHADRVELEEAALDEARWLRLRWNDEWPRSTDHAKDLLDDLADLEHDLVSGDEFRQLVIDYMGPLHRTLTDAAKGACTMELSDPDGIEKWDVGELEELMDDPNTSDASMDRIHDLLEAYHR